MLSIIVPVYRAEHTLERCLRSIVSQSFSDWEAILVDDGSPDASGELCDQWSATDERIRVLHQSNRGVAEARNAAIEIARGDYLTFVDSDDYLEPDLYGPLMQQLSADSSVGMLEYSLRKVGGSAQDTSLSLSDASYDSVWDYWHSTLGWNHGYSCNKIFRRDMLSDLRFSAVPMGEDMVLVARILSRHQPKVVTSSQMGYNYVMLEDSASHKVNRRMVGYLLLAELRVAWLMHTWPWSRNGRNLYYYMCCRVWDLLFC